jgi:hypothetical protein
MSTALLSKVERKSIFDAQDVAPGPGAYTDPRVMKPQLPAFAPFTSTAKRPMDMSDSLTKDLPAPGSYDLETDLAAPSVTAAASAFKSRVERFEATSSMEKIVGPGPGNAGIKRTPILIYRSIRLTVT